MVAGRNDPSIVFPTSPALGEVFGRRQWDGKKWITAGLIQIWDMVRAPGDAEYGRTRGGWRALNQFEWTLTVRKTTDQVITAGTWTLMTWNVVDRNTQNAWNPLTHRYTPTVAGWYLFQSLSPLVAGFMILKNTDVAAHINQIAASNANPHWFQTLTAVTYMNGTTDFINVWTSMNSGNWIQIYGYRNELSAYRLPGW